MSQFIRIVQGVMVGRRTAFSLTAAALLLAGATGARAQTVSQNTGSLGSSANGTNAPTVTLGPGLLPGGDQAAVYDGVAGTNTVVNFQSALNPASGLPFTIEFWAKPAASDNDDAPVSNRISAGNRSGWVFFQRAADQGWNFRMYNGVAGGLGWDLTGGTANLGQWSHVVATWNGSSAVLYVNGNPVDNTNDPAATGVYNASNAANFIVASSDSGSPYNGSIDEVAFYNKVLTPPQIFTHFITTSTSPGAYQDLVRSDGALLQLTNLPEPSAAALLMVGAGVLLRRRRGA